MNEFYKLFDGILTPDRNSVNADLCSPEGRSPYVKLDDLFVATPARHK